MSLPDRNTQLALPLEALSIKMKAGFSPLVCVVGDETGIGKSMFVARSSELIYWRTYGKIWRPKTNAEENLFFFMSRMKKELFNANHRIMVIEEAEIELGSDDWQSIANRWFSRMKSTQRIKGNLYFTLLPMFMLLARKHRRAVNFIWNIKKRGFADCYFLHKKPAQIMGDDMARVYLGSVHLKLPDCKIEYDFYDHENKKAIEQIEGQKYDYEKHLQDKKMEKFKQFVEKQNGNTFKYKCYSCGNKLTFDKKPTKAFKCSGCKTIIYLTNEDLINKDEDSNKDENGENEDGEDEQ
jgi:ribosomal protein S27E